MTQMGEAKRELSLRPLAAYDYVLKGLAEFKRTGDEFSKENVLTLAAEAILRSLHVELSASPLDDIFSQTKNQVNRRLVGVCLLRLLSTDETCFSVSDF